MFMSFPLNHSFFHGLIVLSTVVFIVINRVLNLAKCIGLEIVALNTLGGVSGYFYVLPSSASRGPLASPPPPTTFTARPTTALLSGRSGSCGFFVFFRGRAI